MPRASTSVVSFKNFSKMPLHMISHHVKDVKKHCLKSESYRVCACCTLYSKLYQFSINFKIPLILFIDIVSHIKTFHRQSHKGKITIFLSPFNLFNSGWTFAYNLDNTQNGSEYGKISLIHNYVLDISHWVVIRRIF